MFERFSEGARKLMGAARTRALNSGSDWIGSEHIVLKHADIATGHFLMADLGNPTGVLRQVLPGLEMELLLLRSRIIEVLSKVEGL